MESTRAIRVLLIDDDRDGANSTAILLRHFGADTRAVYDSRWACDEARSFDPDVMLIDLAMPALDGCTVARTLRATPQFKATRLLAVSGCVDLECRDECAAAGFDQYLLKPVPLERLVRMLDETRAAAASKESRGTAECDAPH